MVEYELESIVFLAVCMNILRHYSWQNGMSETQKLTPNTEGEIISLQLALRFNYSRLLFLTFSFVFFSVYPSAYSFEIQMFIVAPGHTQ
jgi:hypothetical protein